MTKFHTLKKTEKQFQLQKKKCKKRKKNLQTFEFVLKQTFLVCHHSEATLNRKFGRKSCTRLKSRGYRGLEIFSPYRIENQIDFQDFLGAQIRLIPFAWI